MHTCNPPGLSFDFPLHKFLLPSCTRPFPFDNNAAADALEVALIVTSFAFASAINSLWVRPRLRVQARRPKHDRSHGDGAIMLSRLVQHCVAEEESRIVN
jgi:hypothetical protein